MAKHGSLAVFDPSQEDWLSYTEHLQLYFTANDVDSEEKHRAILLSVCGPSTYRLIKSLVPPPAKPTDKTFRELVELVKVHHNPKPSIIVERFHFNSRVQKPGETVATFIGELRRLTQHCNYGATLDDML